MISRLRDEKTQYFLTLVIVSAFVHFLYLGKPDSVVFDETGYGKQVNQYVESHSAVFDIHPPHAKLLLAAGAALVGYRGGFKFASIGQEYGDLPIAGMRFVPALFGTIIPLLFFGLLICWRMTPGGAFLGAMALSLDNALTLQSRLLATDAILVASLLAALLCFRLAEMSETESTRYLWVAVSGGFCALALGTKFTGILASGLVVCQSAGQLREKIFRRRFFLDLLVLSSSTCAVYLLGWWIHFGLTPFESYLDLFLSQDATFLRKLVTAHQIMFSQNYFLLAPHQDGSSWWQWPWMRNPIHYWQGNWADVYFVGNPVVWWGSTLGLAIVFFRLVFFRKKTWTHMAMPLGYFAALLPHALIPRVLFLYHYLPSLVFATSLTAGLADAWKISRPGGWRGQSKAFYALVVLIALGFAIVLPVTYGLDLRPPLLRFYREGLARLHG